MSEPKLTLCRCGGKSSYITEGTKTSEAVFVQCDICGIRTPSKSSDLRYSAFQVVADIWNAGSLLWPPWQQGYKYKVGDQVTSNDQSNKSVHWINEKADNTQEPRQSGSGWRFVEYAPVV